jgi:hypothetical protein
MSTYTMFVSWILNFQVNLRKIISWEPHKKLESLVNEIFSYQKMYFLQAKLSAIEKLLEKRRNLVD